MFGFEKEELKILRKLNTPKKIQDFLNNLEINFEKSRDTCMSPRMVLKKRKAHCIEGALFAAVALRLHGYKPLVVDLTANSKDFDHVIAVFKQYGKWGAITKTNHVVLRYREPVYSSIRELVMSFFHEYIDKGTKNLRTFSMPVDLSRFDKFGWMTSEEDIWYIPEYLVEIPHIKVMDRKQIANLRRADKIERKAGDLIDWHRKKGRIIH